MPGLDPGIHAFPDALKTWMAGTSPAMTALSVSRCDLRRRRHAVEPILLSRQRQPSGFHELEALVARLILGALGKLGAVFRIVQELLGLLHGKILLSSKT